ncbi:hypothetical protein DXT68_08700 [Microbacterium foliorum]|uniref:Uncharacterized protein n=2 Tax=Microbacterium foliorum TaxID=104336 RepID=A0A0F0KE95_9MICO|nr:hypothetical protein DXT68_08700 [Microbacterium foliorum]KJL17606.1 hypothetical protein RN50_02703 [Microbacterium foliorum]
MLGEVMGQAATDFANRALSTREEARVSTVLDLAAEEISRRLRDGESFRDDGFFDPGSQDADEVLEGVLRAAQAEHQQKKLPHLARVFANIAFDPPLSAEVANLVIRQAESISWLEMCLVSLISRPEEFPLPAAGLKNDGSTWNDWAVTDSFNSMIGDGGLLYYPPRHPERSLPGFDMRLSSVKLSSRGTLLAGLMDLETIERSEIAAPYEVLVRFATEFEDEGA